MSGCVAQRREAAPAPHNGPIPVSESLPQPPTPIPPLAPALTGKPLVPRASAVAVNVPPPRKAARSCGRVGPSGGWCQIWMVMIAEPPTALTSLAAEGSHGGSMALQT